MHEVRVPAEDRNQVATEINGRAYVAQRGFFTMPEGDAATHLRSAGYGQSWPVSGVPRKRDGYRCTQCGHGSFFVKCKCGATCVREGQ